MDADSLCFSGSWGHSAFSGLHSAFSNLLKFVTELFLACMADGICGKYLHFSLERFIFPEISNY